MSKLVDIGDLNPELINHLFDVAQRLQHDGWADIPAPKQSNYIASLFFENSTRTKISFEIAAKNLKNEVICPNLATSSTQKGESVIDTVTNIAAMGCQNFIVRHQDHQVLQQLKQLDDINLINAGSGSTAHPSQALLDWYTITRRFANPADLTIAIVGDIAHSRVASSFCRLANMLGVKKINLVAPEKWLPTNSAASVEKMTSNLQDGLAGADVVMTLRIQNERLDNTSSINLDDYIRDFQINAKSIKLAKPDAMIMHPGPINREVELTSDIADDLQSVVLQQVTNGVAIRMALIQQFFCG